MKLNLKIALSLILISAVIGVSGYTILSQLDKISDPILNQIPNSIADLVKKSTIDEYAQLIKYYDEVLTQSARNYAFTQDKKWEERYIEVEPKLIEVIDKAVDAGDSMENFFLTQVERANLALVEMEYAAIDLVNAGKASEAIDILESEEYWNYKNFYLEGLNDYTSLVETQHHDAREKSATTLDELSKTTQVLITDSKNMLLFSIPVMLGTLFIAAYILHKSVINPIKKLKDATIRIGNGQWDTHVVAKGNDEIHDLSKSFNEMIDSVRKSTNYIEQLKKIENQKDEFTSMMARALKSPLTLIVGGIDALKDLDVAGELSDKQREAILAIESNANRLQNVISNLLDVQKLEMDRMVFSSQKFCVDDLLNEVVRDYQNIAKEKNIKIQNKSNVSINIQSDKKRLRQVMDNLVRNAIEFVPENTGTILISAEILEDDIIVTVKDNGIGMSEEEQKRLIKKFYQADISIKRKHGGTGLGLSICKGIVEKLGGTILVSSGPKKGTTISFIIPQGDSN